MLACRGALSPSGGNHEHKDREPPRRYNAPGGYREQGHPHDHRQPHGQDVRGSRSRTARSAPWTCGRSRSRPDDFGLMTYDPAFMNTASCKSRITFIDGDKGILRYRGYPIEQLAEQSTYLEVAYLLLNGELPTKAQLRRPGSTTITIHTIVHENIKKFMDGFRYDAHPMGMLVVARSAALSTFYPEAKHIHDPRGRAACQIDRLIAKMPTLAAFAYRHSDRPAVRLPRQRPQLRRQLPQHDVQDDASSKYKAEPGARARARRAVHPARRPRAELLDDRDAQRSARSRSTRTARPPARVGGALRPAARRRQRGGAAHAAGDRLEGQASRRSSRR